MGGDLFRPRWERCDRKENIAQCTRWLGGGGAQVLVTAVGVCVEAGKQPGVS